MMRIKFLCTILVKSDFRIFDPPTEVAKGGFDDSFTSEIHFSLNLVSIFEKIQFPMTINLV
jgi:hypothetical protein